MLLTFRAHHCFDCADPIDLDAHLVTCHEEFRRLHRATNAAGRAGEDQVARFQRHRFTEMRNLVVDVEHQIFGVGVLPPLAVDEAADAHCVRIAESRLP